MFAGLESATVLAICDARQPNTVAVIVIGVVLLAFAAVVALLVRAAGRERCLVAITYLATGVLGVGLHLNGNVEFERELHPTEGGFQFALKTITGATPVLAPGSMVLLGLVGFAHTYRHPCTAGGDTFAGQETSS